MQYGYQRIINKSFDQIDIGLRDSLKKEGFGIITEIDIKKTFKEKLDVDYPKFHILGACNPNLAKKVLDLEPEVAMLMPCNVIFWENKNRTVTISAIDANRQLSVSSNPEVVKIGENVNSMLKLAIDRL